MCSRFYLLPLNSESKHILPLFVLIFAGSDIQRDHTSVFLGGVRHLHDQRMDLGYLCAILFSE